MSCVYSDCMSPSLPHAHTPVHTVCHLQNFMTSESPAAFPFFYIEPAKPQYQAITMKYTGQVSRKELDQIAPIGNSPTFMTLEDMKRVRAGA